MFPLRSIHLHTQLFDEGKREENVGGLIGLHRSRQMAKAKSKSGSRVKHMNKGQFGIDPQFIVTKRLWNLRLLFNFWGNPL